MKASEFAIVSSLLKHPQPNEHLLLGDFDFRQLIDGLSGRRRGARAVQLIEQLRNDGVETAAAPRVIRGIAMYLEHVHRKAAAHCAADTAADGNGDATRHKCSSASADASRLCQILQHVDDHVLAENEVQVRQRVQDEERE